MYWKLFDESSSSKRYNHAATCLYSIDVLTLANPHNFIIKSLLVDTVQFFLNWSACQFRLTSLVLGHD